jgi:TolA-binding protein
LQLSLLISNALFNDSTGLPLSYFAKADLLIFQNKLDEAIVILDSINQKFTNHSLEDEIFFQKAMIYEKKQDWKQAEQMYLNIINFYPQEMYADDAVYNLAKLYQNKLNDKQKAMEYYLKLLNDYPGSLYVPDARKMYRTLRGDEVNN